VFFVFGGRGIVCALSFSENVVLFLFRVTGAGAFSGTVDLTLNNTFVESQAVTTGEYTFESIVGREFFGLSDTFDLTIGATMAGGTVSDYFMIDNFQITPCKFAILESYLLFLQSPKFCENPSFFFCFFETLVNLCQKTATETTLTTNQLLILSSNKQILVS
jgi:hypothetical protein